MQIQQAPATMNVYVGVIELDCMEFVMRILIRDCARGLLIHQKLAAEKIWKETY